MSTLFRRLIYLFAVAALLINYAFAVQPAFAKSVVTNEIPPKPDLVITSVVFTNSCVATFTIKNIGLGAANVSFRFHAYPIPEEIRWSAPILGLPAGGVATQTWQNVKVMEASTIIVIVDPENQVQESNELNNRKSFFVPVRCRVWNSGL